LGRAVADLACAGPASPDRPVAVAVSRRRGLGLVIGVALQLTLGI
jgi:hypothetical protein